MSIELLDGLNRDLKKHGVKVRKVEGWRTRRASTSTFAPRGVLCHHTASSRTGGDSPALNICVHGRSDLPGPLCNFHLSRDGVVTYVAAGRANHAGLGGPIKGIPLNSGNSYLWGIEAENNGIDEPWPEKQIRAYAILCALLLKLVKADVSMVIAHKEYTSRKIDPHFEMDAFRHRVRKALK